jgi:3-deoxy-7-phosphoheptulonate synthase
LIIEVHPRPEEALCDGAQALTKEQYLELFDQARNIFDVVVQSELKVAETSDVVV